MDEQHERETIRTVVDMIAEHTRQAAARLAGPGLGETYRTPELLAEAGVEYVCDWTADDQPFPMRVKTGASSRYLTRKS